MPLVVVGSVAFDSVETPTQKRDNLLGGSAVFFSYAASYFTSVRLAGVVGEDWPARAHRIAPEAEHRHRRAPGRRRREDVPLAGAIPGEHERPRDARPATERHGAVRSRRCRSPIAAASFSSSPTASPQMQMRVLDQCPGAALVVADTMDYWIQNDRESLLVAAAADRRPGAQRQRGQAAHGRREPGPRRPQRADASARGFVVVKKGEHGAMFFSEHETYVLPAYPTPNVVDPTGAGDCFAGGMMGYLAEQGNFEPKTLKEAMAYGTVAASFTVEDFSLDRLQADRSRRPGQADGGVSPDVELLSVSPPLRPGEGDLNRGFTEDLQQHETHRPHVRRRGTE